MARTIHDDLDQAIAGAYRALGQARARWAHSPNASTSEAVDKAEQAVNDLLELRPRP